MQLAIDGIKRVYEVDPTTEIRRIRNLDCMKKYEGCDFPEFMRYTRKVDYTKNGKPRDYEDVKADKDKRDMRINPTLRCPMNTLVGVLSSIPRMSQVRTIPTENFFIKEKGRADSYKIGKVRKLCEECSYQIYLIMKSDDLDYFAKHEMIESVYDNILEEIQKVKINNSRTYNRLIGLAIGVEAEGMQIKQNIALLRLLHRMNPAKFLQNFSPAQKMTIKNPM